MTAEIFSKKLTKIFKSIIHIPLLSTKNFSEHAPSIFRQRFGALTEQQMNIQIGQELQASHSYLAMANFFGQTDISLNGASSFFQAMSDEERDHAFQLINYQNMRGGRVSLHSILKPKDDFSSLFMAIEHALLLERSNTSALMELVDVAEKDGDIVTVDFIISKFLKEQMESLQSLGKILTRLKKFEQPGLGEYLIDQELQKEYPLRDKISKMEK